MGGKAAQVGTAALAATAAAVLAGCGSHPASLSRSASPATVQSRLAHIAGRWSTTEATIEETETGGPHPGTVWVHLTTAGGGAEIRASWTGPHGHAHLLVADRREVVSYTSGSGRYTVEPAGTQAGDPRWVLGTGLGSFLASAHPLGVSFSGRVVSLRCQAPLPGGSGQAVLAFNTADGRPVKWSATWAPEGGHGAPETLAESVHGFTANPPLAGDTFTFTPPPGAAGQVLAEGPDGTAVPVSQGVVLPPPGSGLTLEGATTDGGNPPVLVLAYTDSGGRPLLVTEFPAARGPADPAGSGPTPITIAGLAADTATLADGQDYLGFTWHGTRVWLEGTAQDVSDFASLWLTVLGQGGSAPPPAGSSPRVPGNRTAG